MINRIASLLVVLAPLTLTGCDSSNGPMAPTPVVETSGASTFSKPPDTGPIVVDRGELDFSGLGVNVGVGEIRLEGNRGFSLNARVTRVGGVVQAIEACNTSNCAPGDSIPLGAHWSGNDLPATVTLDGITYTGVGGLNSPTSALVQFAGSVVAPPLTNRGSDQVTAPFTLSGVFSSPEGGEQFTGEGVVKLWLAHVPGTTGWRVERLLYRFKHRP